MKGGWYPFGGRSRAAVMGLIKVRELRRREMSKEIAEVFFNELILSHLEISSLKEEKKKTLKFLGLDTIRAACG